MKAVLLSLAFAATVVDAFGNAGLKDASEKAASDLEGTCIVVATLDGKEREVSLHGSPVDTEPDEVLFEIGSISKVFTGLLLAVSVEQGKVRYDTTLDDLLDLEFADPRVGEITLLQLATHTSGLPRLPDNNAFDGHDPYRHYTRRDLDEYLRSTKLKQDAPHEASYSNLGHGLLGNLISRVWEKEWGELVAQEIAGPLGLRDTCQHPTKAQAQQLAPPRDGDKAGHRWQFDALAGAGALHSTAADLLRFGQAFLHPEDTPMENALKEVMKIHSEAHGLGGAIGLGLMIRSLDGETELSHSGGTGGYRSHLQILPESSIVRVVLCNNTSVTPASLVAAARSASKLAEAKVVLLEQAQLDLLTGVYRIDQQSKFTVIRNDDHLLAQLTGQSFLRLDALSETRFRYRAVDAELEFDLGEPARPATRLTLFQNGREIVARRSGEDRPELRFPKAADLAEYAGAYELAAGSVIQVSVRGDTLFAQLTGQTAFPVFQTDDDRFRYLIVDAALEFERNAEQQITSLILDQNGRHRAQRK